MRFTREDFVAFLKESPVGDFAIYDSSFRSSENCGTDCTYTPDDLSLCEIIRMVNWWETPRILKRSHTSAKLSRSTNGAPDAPVRAATSMAPTTGWRRRRDRRRRESRVTSSFALARALVVALVVVLVVGAANRGCEAKETLEAFGGAADGLDALKISRTVPESMRTLLASPCDAYSKTFAREPTEVLRLGTLAALRAVCEAEDEGAERACETKIGLERRGSAMDRDDVLDALRDVMHEACQAQAARLSDPEGRDASAARAHVRAAVTRAAEEEASSEAAQSAPKASRRTKRPAKDGQSKMTKDKVSGRGMWGWDRHPLKQSSVREAFGASLSVDSIKHQERQALLDMFRRTNGNKWHRRDGWMTDRSYCHWYGIECQEDGYGVTFIDLRENNLHGDMPQSIDELRMLQGLDLSHNKLEGRLSAMLGELKDLRYLLVRGNTLYSDIPAGLFRKNSKLHQLDLSDNSLSGKIPLKEFEQLGDLRLLNISSNSLSGPMPALAKLPFLEVFSAAKNALRGEIPPFEPTTKIRFFDVSGNYLHGQLPILPKNVGWVLFDVSFNALSGEIVDTEFPKTLRVYSVAKNQLAGTIPQQFSKLPNLEHFDVSSNMFEGGIPSAVLRKKTLRHYNISRNAFEGELPTGVYQGENERQTMRLEVLDVSHNKLTGRLPQSLVELNNIRVIDASHNHLSGDLPSLWSTSKLARLDLKANEFTGAMPSALAAAHLLEHLDLSENKLTSRVNLNVITLRNLKHLDVSGNQMDWSGVAAPASKPPSPRLDRLRAITPPHDEL